MRKSSDTGLLLFLDFMVLYCNSSCKSIIIATMIEYKYSKKLLWAYLLFIPISLLIYGFALLVLLTFIRDVWVVLGFLLASWFFVHIYIVLRIFRSRMVISADSLVVFSSFTSSEIAYSRVLAYKTYVDNRRNIFSFNPFFFIAPLPYSHTWVEIHYKDYKGKMRLFKKDITFFKNHQELLNNLNNYLLKK